MLISHPAKSHLFDISPVKKRLGKDEGYETTRLKYVASGSGNGGSGSGSGSGKIISTRADIVAGIWLIWDKSRQLKQREDRFNTSPKSGHRLRLFPDLLHLQEEPCALSQTNDSMPLQRTAGAPRRWLWGRKFSGSRRPTHALLRQLSGTGMTTTLLE